LSLVPRFAWLNTVIRRTVRTSTRCWPTTLRAEKPIKVQANGRTVYEWQEKPGQDNEGLDCLVGCAVAASIEKINRDERAADCEEKEAQPC
jgi:phage terminase large subunit GpA-like protein